MFGKKKTEAVTYVTENETQYVVSDKVNLHGGEEVGRTAYLSPKIVKRIVENSRAEEPKIIDRDTLFAKKPYDQAGDA